MDRPHDRRLAFRAWTEIRDLDKSNSVVIQPIGAVEQHGPHLPCCTDMLLAAHIAEAAAAECAAADNVWLLPTLAYGKSNEHLGFPGTITLSAETLMSVCRDLGTSIAASGFRKLVFVNGHGGQPQLLELVARDIRAETDLQVFPLFPYSSPLPEEIASCVLDGELGIHAGHLETSMMMACDSTLVRLDQMEVGAQEVRAQFGAYRYLRLDGGAAAAWLTRDLSANGVIGDPRGATPELGQRALQFYIDELAGALDEIATFDFPAVESDV